MTVRRAGLAMYDLPGLELATDALWQAIARRLAAAGIAGVPAALDRTTPIESLWQDPRLLLAQSCGYPLVTSLSGRVQLVATPRYRVPGCSGARHSSAIIVRRDDARPELAALRGSRCAVNQRDSNTGMNLLRAAIAPLAGGEAFFADVSWTGSHRSSLERVAAGTADLAAVDAVTLAYLARLDPDLIARIRVLGWTASTPALPFITAADMPDDFLHLLRRALFDVARDPGADAIRRELLLDGFEILSLADYAEVLEIERRAVLLGYPELR